jgi:hypothetical protein
VSRGTPGGSAVPFERRGPGRQKRRLAVLDRQPEFWIYFTDIHPMTGLLS